MPTKPPNPKGPRAVPDKERRAPGQDRRAPVDTNGKASPMRRLKGVLGRPLAVERRDGQLQVVLVERRRAKPAEQRPSPSQLCEELGARVLAHDPQQVSKDMSHLLLVHDALGSKGWPGVAALPRRVLAGALAQAEALAGEESSLSMETFIEGLRPLLGAAELREERGSRLQDFRVGETVEVSETNHAEFDRLEQSWVGTIPSDLSRRERDS